MNKGTEGPFGQKPEPFDTIVSISKLREFGEKYRMGIVSVSKFVNRKVSYQYQYRNFNLKSIGISIGIIFFTSSIQVSISPFKMAE